jgi:hypothetical protein
MVLKMTMGCNTAFNNFERLMNFREMILSKP